MRHLKDDFRRPVLVEDLAAAALYERLHGLSGPTFGGSSRLPASRSAYILAKLVVQSRSSRQGWKSASVRFDRKTFQRLRSRLGRERAGMHVVCG